MPPQAERTATSVIIPVRNGPDYLRACLSNLAACPCKDYEIIVVDDASTDETPRIAEEMGARVVRRQTCGGPAAARNDGAAVAQGEYLFFIDADVCVHPDAICRVVEAFQDPTVDAVFGSYDTDPAALNVLSQYKNLFHHFVHQDSCEQASTFWAGCGAVRRSVFLEMGGFDAASFARPCIEDIELGVRLHKAGRRILLDKGLQGTHLKQWSLWSIVRTDVWDRGVPWAQLILNQGALPNDLNLKLSQRISAVLAYSLLATLAVGAWYYHGLILLPILGLLGILMVDYWSVSRRVPTTLRVLAVLGAVATVGMISFYFKMWTLVGLACLLGIVLINYRFYMFFARQRHPLFAALVVPLHVLYFLYSGAAFGLGACLHLWKGLVLGRPGPREEKVARTAR